MLITSGSWSFCQISPKTGNYSDKMPPLDKWIYVIFFIEADQLLYWSAIYTVLLWIFEATPSWPRCKQWSTREKVSQQCLWKMQRNVQMFWFNTVHNEASTYHENPNSKVSINMKIQHFPPSPPGHLNIWRLVCLIPCPRGQNCVEIPHPSAGFDGHFCKPKSDLVELFSGLFACESELYTF